MLNTLSNFDREPRRILLGCMFLHGCHQLEVIESGILSLPRPYMVYNSLSTSVPYINESSIQVYFIF